MSGAARPGAHRATHRCPGCHAPGVLPEMFSCRPCWRRLPWEYRDRVMVTWRARRHNPASTVAMAAHRRAMGDAEDWYTNHPS